MLKYVIVALACLALTEAAVLTPTLTSRRLSNPFGVVEGIENCGSEGQIRQVRVTDCVRVPCEVYVGGIYLVEVDFVPRYSHPILELKVILYHDGRNITIVDQEVENSAVIGGNPYTFAYNMPISGEFMGFSELWVGIIGSEALELCGIAGLLVHP